MTKSDIKLFYFLESSTFSDNNSRKDSQHNEIDIMKNNVCQIIFNSSNEN